MKTERTVPEGTSRASVCLVLHAYQPPWLADFEIEDLVRTCYQPTLALHHELRLPLTLNIQGCLLERLQRLAPRFVDRIGELLALGLLEVTVSSYYHPCLPLLPRERRHSQIVRHFDVLRNILGVRPVGFWPPELAWTPALTEELTAIGVQWVIVDGSALVRGWSIESTREEPSAALSAVYLPSELMRAYRFATAGDLVALPRQHLWSQRLFEQEALGDVAGVAAFMRIFGEQARGIVCLAADAERLAGDSMRGYELILRRLAALADVVTPTVAIERRPPTESIALPIWTWRGALEEWVRGEGERSFLRELDDARRRLATLSMLSHDEALGARADDLLMRAESSCCLFWRVPCAFLAEGFEHIGHAQSMMDRM